MSEKRKGNTTNSRRDTTAVIDLNKRYSEEVKQYKHFAEVRRAKRKYSQESVARIYKQIKDYVEECHKNKEPLTIAGTILATNTQKDMWLQARNGDMDYLLDEYITLNNISESDITYDDNSLPWYFGTSDNPVDEPVLLIQYSDLAKNRDLMIQEQLERNCYTNRGNPAGSIFSLKHNYGWREDDTPQHVVNQLVIADLDQAKKALEMLK